jgi:outer membrane protein assembly factor BamB
MARHGTVSRAKGMSGVSLTQAQKGLAIVVLLGLAACAEPEVILPGERIDVATGQPVGSAPVQRVVPFSAPAARANAGWTHRAGTPAGDLVNPALGPVTGRIWSAPIGQGERRGHRITARPVVAEGRIFTLDSEARVTALSLGGAALWSVDVSPARDRAEEGSGGGLALADGRLFVTLGFGDLVALDPATGREIWRNRLGAVATGAPTVAAGQVHVVGRDGTGWTVDAATGRNLWSVRATPDRLGVKSGAGPAATAATVVFPFNSGEVIAADPRTGAVQWTAYLLGERAGRSYARVTDITGDPVVIGGRVYVGNHSGETAAIEIGTGQTVWTAEHGAFGPVSVAGGSVFLVSDQNDLVRLDAATGATLWEVDLPLFVDPRPRRREGIFAHYGPLLAGGRLIVASSDAQLRFFDPASGALTGSLALPAGAAVEPVVAGGTLYIVTSDGTLNAFR